MVFIIWLLVLYVFHMLLCVINQNQVEQFKDFSFLSTPFHILCFIPFSVGHINSTQWHSMLVKCSQESSGEQTGVRHWIQGL